MRTPYTLRVVCPDVKNSWSAGCQASSYKLHPAAAAQQACRRISLLACSVTVWDVAARTLGLKASCAVDVIC